MIMPMMMNGMGWLPDLPDHRDIPLLSVERELASVPLRVSGLSRSIPCYDQGSLGSCTANASGRLFQFVDIKQGGLNIFPSRLQVYYDSRKIRGWENWDSGAFLRDTLSVIRNNGAAPEELWPYDISKFTQAPTPAVYAEAANHQSLVYMSVSQSLSAMESCIASGYPFVIGASLYENFVPDANGVIPMPSGSSIGGHAFLVDGYDHNTRLFECPNSWGTTWGDRGYFFMHYDYLLDNDLAADLWTIRSVEEGFVPPPPPPPPPTPDFVAFDGVVVKANSNKVVVTPNSPVLKNIAGRQIRATFSGGTFNGKCKTMEQNWIVIKPTTFDMTWDLAGDTIHIETI